MRGLVHWPDRPTLVIISHDAGVVEFADRVYRLDQGSLTSESRMTADASAVGS